MTNMNGEETLKHFKENSDFNVPVIALTADESVNAYKTPSCEFCKHICRPNAALNLSDKISGSFENLA